MPLVIPGLLHFLDVLGAFGGPPAAEAADKQDDQDGTEEHDEVVPAGGVSDRVVQVLDGLGWPDLPGVGRGGQKGGENG